MKLAVITFFLIFHLFNGIESLEAKSALDIEPAFVLRVVNQFRSVLNKAASFVIESQRENFATGWPELGLPPVDPFYVEDYQLKSDELEGFSRLNQNLTGVTVKGLQNFEIRNVDIRPALMSANLVLYFNQLNLEGFHDTEATIGGPFPISTQGQGPFTLRLNNVFLSVSVQFDWINFSFIRLHELSVNGLSGLAVANFQGFPPAQQVTFNAVASIALPAYLIVKQNDFNQRIKEEIIPLVNTQILDDVSFVEFFQFSIRFLRNFAVNTAIDFVQDLVCDL